MPTIATPRGLVVGELCETCRHVLHEGAVIAHEDDQQGLASKIGEANGTAIDVEQAKIGREVPSFFIVLAVFTMALILTR